MAFHFRYRRSCGACDCMLVIGAFMFATLNRTGDTYVKRNARRIGGTHRNTALSRLLSNSLPGITSQQIAAGQEMFRRPRRQAAGAIPSPQRAACWAALPRRAVSDDQAGSAQREKGM
jgi:hypothetical protein